MKRILFCLLLITALGASAQQYNNEWIDYSKTYYKFKIGRTGVHRIPASVLASAGLGTAPAEQFQLWRNGEQVPLYTSAATGPLPAAGFIEFWAKANDGKPDNQLYRNPAYQLNNKYSLSTDTATYFLTLNPALTQNLRLADAVNDVASNTLPAEPYFMYTTGRYFNDRINTGFAVNVGEYMYSSSYDKGEGWSSADISSAATPTGTDYGTHNSTLSNLKLYSGAAPAPVFKIAVSGNVINQRRYKVTINGDSVLGNQVDYFNYSVDSAPFSATTLASNTANITVTNIASLACLPLPTGCQTDRMVIHRYELTYPRLFDFGGAQSFEFNLPASATGFYLQISNLAYGSTAPVLYDLTNGKRYTANLSGAPQLRFVLPPSADARELVLTNLEPANLGTVNSLQTKNFINYSNSGNTAEYLIISNPALFAGAGGSNPVEDYRAYRASQSGGGFNAKIYLADEIVDQFGFGIKKFPGAIRNFIRYARDNYPAPPKFVFLIGKGVNYLHQKNYENASAGDQVNLEKLNLVPTFGWPASDALLTANPGSSLPLTPIGRLSAIAPNEVAEYLNKIKEFEQAQKLNSPLIADKGWNKNVVHIVGASDSVLGTTLLNAMNGFTKIISDTLYGGSVSTFAKTTSDAVAQLNSTDLINLFNEGISLITYFGHSSASTLEFNLENPENYSNQGKYPLFLGLGCNAGNFYNYNPLRFITKETISERYVLAPNRGTIGFIASSHFGIVHYLDIWNTRFYKRIANTGYSKTIGENMINTIGDVFQFTTQEDFYARSNAEETALHGDPAIRLNPQPKPDYVIEDPMVKVTPGFVSVADGTFKVEAKMKNLGSAPNVPIVAEIKRQYPDGSTAVVWRDTIPGIRYMDSITANLTIDPIHDKGLNRITVSIDADNTVDELFETNNSVTKDIMIFEDEARPVYPYNFAIINKPTLKLLASTANPFSLPKQYRMEMDTTETFNSPFKISQTQTAPGGILSFDPGVTFTNNTVYYWRVATVPASGPLTWNGSSFVYIAGSDLGFNQSHYYQHLKSSTDGVSLDNARRWDFGNIASDVFIRNGVFPTAANQAVDISIAVDGDAYIRSVCGLSNVIFTVFDPRTFKPWLNAPVGQPGLYGSDPVCASDRKYNFQFSILDTASRRKIVEFLDLVPSGHYVVVRNTSGTDPLSNTYTDTWKHDTTYFGSGNSIYHRLYAQGFADIDSFFMPRAFAFIYKKNQQSVFTPKSAFTQGIYDKLTLSAFCETQDTIGHINSPKFGPAKAWKEFRWNGHSLDPGTGDDPLITLLGIRNNGQVDTVMNGIPLSQSVVNISGISAAQYPFLQIRMQNFDTTYYTPFQLDSWKLTYDPAPEGAISPNLYFSMKDTVDVAEPLEFKIAFKNISEAAFTDSVKVRVVVTDKNNVSHVLPAFKQRPIGLNDTLNVRYAVDTRHLVGNNAMYVEVNPDNDQPEQYHFNNIFYKTFYVRPDTLNPLMDVTFDNVRILNHDIVSAKPTVMIRLKDESKWYLLSDTATVNVSVAFPDHSVRNYHFDGTTMQYIPAQQAPNSDNTATVNLRPEFDQDGEYEMTVSAKDMSDNRAGALQYKVAFQVFNKAMISNMLNYPNPFTTSTAFVFTITGAEVPQNIRIQIMTVTGKVVREITKEELGPLHIGRNITEFKWDGTDQYGQKLANGVYLYRVVTNLNGKSLDRFKAANDNTDKFFNNGYGKMYLMR